MSDTYDYEPDLYEDDQDERVERPKKLVGEILHETPKAILFQVNGAITKGGSWFPLSQVYKIVRNPQRFEGSETREELENWAPSDEIHVAPWLAKKKGL